MKARLSHFCLSPKTRSPACPATMLLLRNKRTAHDISRKKALAYCENADAHSYFVSAPNIKLHNLLQIDFFKIMSDILLFEA